MGPKKIIKTLLVCCLGLSFISCEYDEDEIDVYNQLTDEARTLPSSSRIMEEIEQYVSAPSQPCPAHIGGSSSTPGQPVHSPQGFDVIRHMESEYSHLKNCGYKVTGFTRSEVSAFRDQYQKAINDQPLQCHVSNCTTASYLALIEILKRSPHYDRLKPHLHFDGPIYEAFRGVNSIERTFNLIAEMTGDSSFSTYKKIPRNQIQSNVNNGWPKRGDVLLLNRTNRSGHMTIFSHMEGDRICYWSSNRGTRGKGLQCEPTSRMASIHVGRIDL